MRAIIATGLALCLAACGGQPPAATNNAATATTNATENTIAALPEGARNAVFMRAIRDTGGPAAQSCQHVDRSSAAGEYRTYPVWRAHCDDGSSFTIVLTAPDTAQVINDAEARLAGVNLTEPAAENAAAPEHNGQGH